MNSEIFEQIIELINENNNIILHGPGGTGKSWILRRIAEYLYDNGVNVCCTATTGVAALNLNVLDKISSSTLHSWSGIGLGNKDYRSIAIEIVAKGGKTLRKWRQTEVLIVDEISMLGKKTFTLINNLGKLIRGNQKPFGGIQLVFCGDFLQLPPVKDDWVFEADEWEQLNLKPVIFKIPYRFDDNDFFDLLVRVRTGSYTKNDIAKLKARVIAYKKINQILKELDSENVIKPTILYSRKLDVEAYNQQELNKLQTNEKIYHCEDSFVSKRDGFVKEYYKKLLDDTISDCLSLKPGAQVMLKYNLDIDLGLVNGSRGVILETEDDRVLVRFINGKTMYIEKHIWEIKDKYGISSRKQIPFILAWALTTHKSQGATLDYVVCNLGPKVFACGQAGVALSRVRNLESLFISEFIPSSIKVDQKALDYTKILES